VEINPEFHIQEIFHNNKGENGKNKGKYFQKMETK
jgi:hypothetical protein